MPAKSKKQQRFMALVKLYQEGKIKNPSESVRRAAESMDSDDVRHFAATRHEGLPEKVASLTRAYLYLRSEKKAWTKTPVVIQNKDAVYEFESLEDACQYLASIGTLSYDEVNEMLSNREGLINGFRVTYPNDKIAEVVLVDPYRKQNEMLRANRIIDKILEPEDNSDSAEILREEDRRKKREAKKLVEDLVAVKDVPAKALKTISNLLDGLNDVKI